MSYGPYVGVIRGFYDGDTAYIDLDLGFGFPLLAVNPITGKHQWRCRLVGINAPELEVPDGSGIAARDFALGLAPPGTWITAVSYGWDRYGGRWDGQVTLPSGDDLATVIMNAGHATPMRR